jgi:hypothetical protein
VQRVFSPDRRYPSPAAQRRRDAQWKVRIGLTLIILLFVLATVFALRVVRSRDGTGGAPLAPILRPLS